MSAQVFFLGGDPGTNPGGSWWCVSWLCSWGLFSQVYPGLGASFTSPAGDSLGVVRLLSSLRATGAGRTGRVQPGGFGWGVSGLVVVCNRDTHGANERRREVGCGVVKQKSSAVAKSNFGGGYDSQGQGIAQQPPRSPTLLQGECPSWTVVHCHILPTCGKARLP